MNNRIHESNGPTYRIGAVSRLTGVGQDTLRVWERRYNAVVPMRTEAGTRLYSQMDINRLTLIKRLVDSGDAISSVANLSLEQLQGRLEQSPITAVVDVEGKPCRVAVLGDVLANRLGLEMEDDEKLILLGVFQDRTQFLDEVPKLDADVIILEYSTLQPDHIKEIGLLLQRSGAKRALVAYGFAASATLDRLGSARIMLLRMPVDQTEIRRWCHSLSAQPVEAVTTPVAGMELSGEAPARRFDDSDLAKIAAASVSVRCECPHHLVDMISNLSAFENYSEECEVLNVDDAALHAFLHSTTAQARFLLESALERVIEVDGIDIN